MSNGCSSQVNLAGTNKMYTPTELAVRSNSGLRCAGQQSNSSITRLSGLTARSVAASARMMDCMTVRSTHRLGSRHTVTFGGACA